MLWLKRCSQVSGPILVRQVSVFPIVSIGESVATRATDSCLVQVLKRCCLARVETSSGHVVKDPDAAKLEKHRGVNWLLCSGNGTHGWNTVVPESQSCKAGR